MRPARANPALAKSRPGGPSVSVSRSVGGNAAAKEGYLYLAGIRDSSNKLTEYSVSILDMTFPT